MACGRRGSRAHLERVADEGQQGLDHRDPLPRVHDHDRYVRGDRQRLPHVLRLERSLPSKWLTATMYGSPQLSK